MFVALRRSRYARQNHTFGDANGQALYDRAPRTMSGGEPSSIKRAQLCDTVSLFVRVSKRMAPLCGLSCFFMYRLL